MADNPVHLLLRLPQDVWASDHRENKRGEATVCLTTFNSMSSRSAKKIGHDQLPSQCQLEKRRHEIQVLPAKLKENDLTAIDARADGLNIFELLLAKMTLMRFQKRGGDGVRRGPGCLRSRAPLIMSPRSTIRVLRCGDRLTMADLTMLSPVFFQALRSSRAFNACLLNPATGSHVGRCFTARDEGRGPIRDQYVLYFRSIAGERTDGEEVDEHGAWAPALVRRDHGALSELDDQIVHGRQPLAVRDLEQGPRDVSVKYGCHLGIPRGADRRGAAYL